MPVQQCVRMCVATGLDCGECLNNSSGDISVFPDPSQVLAFRPV